MKLAERFFDEFTAGFTLSWQGHSVGDHKLKNEIKMRRLSNNECVKSEREQAYHVERKMFLSRLVLPLNEFFLIR